MTTPITPEQREPYDELRALDAKATPGPWEVTAEDWATISSGPDAVVMSYAADLACEGCGDPAHGAPEVVIGAEDAALIAAMRNALPALLDALAAAEARASLWKETARHLTRHMHSEGGLTLRAVRAAQHSNALAENMLARAEKAEAGRDEAQRQVQAVRDVLAHHPYGGPDQEDAIRRVLDGEAGR